MLFFEGLLSHSIPLVLSFTFFVLNIPFCSSEKCSKCLTMFSTVQVNCVTEIMWDEAIERARYLDSLPEPIGPLHGLPISVKEHHGMRGKTCNASNVAWIGLSSVDNYLNNILYDAGCVYYVRTTQPQTIMQLECNSNIYGRTANPYNRDLSAGGSSGGEGALIGMRGSLLVCC